MNDKNKVLGILSKRDFVFENNLDTPIYRLMTPASKLVTTKPKTTREEARTIFEKYKIEKLPVVDKDGKLVGLITAKSLFNETKYPISSRDKRGRLLVGAAVGVKEQDKDRAKELVRMGADVLVIDIAHGHAQSVLEMPRFIKKNFSVEVIAGNVAGPEGVADLAKAGADGVKVGIGAGAGTVMVGTLLAGTDEAPGAIVTRNGRKYKVTRGMASLGANMARKFKDNSLDEKVLEELREYVAEGIEALVPYRGKSEEILNQLIGGLRSGMSYTGAHSILEMQRKARFVQITPAGIREGGAHDVEVI